MIGPSTTKLPGGSRNGFYGLMRGLAFSKSMLRKYASIRMPCRPDIELNLIPVDYPMQDIKKIISNDFGQNTIYHLSAARGPSVRDTLATIFTTLNIDNVKLVSLSNPPSRIVGMLPEGTQFYYPYVQLDRRFKGSCSHRWVITKQELTMFIAQAHRETLSRQSEELRSPAGGYG